MAPYSLRDEDGHAAARLRIALERQLAAPAISEEATERVLYGLHRVDRYLNSTSHEGGLTIDQLKREVAEILSGKAQRKVRSATAAASGAGTATGTAKPSKPKPKAFYSNTRSVLAADKQLETGKHPEVVRRATAPLQRTKYEPPPELLAAYRSRNQGKGYIVDPETLALHMIDTAAAAVPTAYSSIAVAQAEVERRRLRELAEANRRKQEAARAAWDKQMEEIQAARDAEARERRADARRVDDALSAHRDALLAEAGRSRAKMDRLKGDREAQRLDLEARARKEAEIRRFEQWAEAEAAREEVEAEAERKRVARERAQEETRRAMEDNLRRLSDKERAKREQQARDKALQEENARIQAGREQARLDEVQRRKEKLEEAFKRGGGDALTKGLAERAAEDERRMKEALAAQAKKDAADQAARRAKQKRLEDEQMSMLAYQISLKRAEEAREAEAARQLGEKIRADLAALKEEQTQAKAKKLQYQHSTLEDQRRAMRAEAARRFRDATELAPQEALYQTKVVMGLRPSFI